MITNLVRDYGVEPCIVRMASTDDYEILSAPGYITSQYNSILAINSGDFQWDLSDIVLCYYINDVGAGSWAWFTISPDFTSLNAFGGVGGVGSSTVTLSDAQVLAATATPQLLIAAPGASNAIVVTNLQLVTNVSPASPFANGGSGVVEYGAIPNGVGTNALSGSIPNPEIAAAVSQIYNVSGYNSGTVSTGITNQGIYFSTTNPPFTAGVGSSLTFVLSYNIIPAVV